MSLLTDLDGESEESSVSKDRSKWIDKDSGLSRSGSTNPSTDRSNDSPTASKAGHDLHRLLITDQSLLSDEAQRLAKTTATEIHEFDGRSADIDDAIDTLNKIKSNLKELDTDTGGINAQRLQNISTRVEKTLSKFETLKEALVTANRRIVLVEQTMPAVKLLDVDKELQNAILLAEELGRETTRFADLQHGVGRYIKEIPAEKRQSHDATKPTEIADEEAGIPPNIISEYYDSVRNLRQLTTAIDAVVDDMDEPMQRWCDAVEAFMAGDLDKYPSYGRMHIERNGFTMAEYRDKYGDGNKTSEFHIIEVDPLTETVQQLLEDFDENQSLSDIYLPVTPESNTRLPVIVETDAEVTQAISLLKELPRSFQDPVPSSSSTQSDSGSKSSEREEPETDIQNEDEETDDTPTDGSTNISSESLTEIGGITEDVARALRAADVTTPEQLTEMQLDDLAEIDGVSPGTAQRIKMQVG